MTQTPKRASGFTIIEALIVLAIAGSIVMIVFLAVPAAQRNARNVQRRRDAATAVTFIRERTTANNNNLPRSCNNRTASCYLRDIRLSYYDNQTTSRNTLSFWNRSYLGAFNDATDEQLEPEDPQATERISIRSWAKCTTDGRLTGEDADQEDIAAQFALEGFSRPILQCIEL